MGKILWLESQANCDWFSVYVMLFLEPAVKCTSNDHLLFCFCQQYKQAHGGNISLNGDHSYIQNCAMCSQSQCNGSIERAEKQSLEKAVFCVF